VFSNHPNQDTGDEDHSEIAACGLLVAGGDPAELLDAVEEALDEVSLLVDVPVEVSWFGASPGRDHGLTALGDDQLDHIAGVEGLVGEDVLALLSAQQSARLGNIVNLPTGDPQVDRIAEGIDDHMDLGREATA
jgi:hypothetical protein